MVTIYRANKKLLSLRNAHFGEGGVTLTNPLSAPVFRVSWDAPSKLHAREARRGDANQCNLQDNQCNLQDRASREFQLPDHSPLSPGFGVQC